MLIIDIELIEFFSVEWFSSFNDILQVIKHWKFDTPFNPKAQIYNIVRYVVKENFPYQVDT